MTYASPQPEPDGAATTTDSVRLVMAPNPATLSPGQAESYQAGKLTVSINFLLSSEVGDGLYPTAEPLGDGEFPAYYSSWAYATITGLLAEPIVLKDYYATTGTLGHKGLSDGTCSSPQPILPCLRPNARPWNPPTSD